ncbi:MurR/RpiR family transcriptional regulator [Humibacter sp.]|jgi:DNA-binding MurR/RpiR family transcriptional regulator|uniref:MurR/RpiR family transcriptional regulator n=1 Tax=Humibacter sp. TaxID=1940291 RepID=UPI002CD2FFCF|nr:MurR/RpiR family transcriptional regulator [Humibacter sp.]HVX07356.1 MurR/RpiR family transcriptional regulator [Humibacter sp.]
MSIQSSMQALSDGYPPSMKRIAEVVIARPQAVLEMTISELARLCDTSETTLVRFARTLGFPGYAAMKLQMAAELAAETAQLGADSSYGSDIAPTDTLAETVAKISGSELFGIRETAASLDLDTLQSVIDAVAAAERTVAFGVAASNMGARDLREKLLRIGRVALGFTDAHDAVSSASLLGPRDVVIGFSHSGQTREVCELLRVAHEGGATTVAITNVPGSPVTRDADLTLLTSVRETTFRSGAMASRIAQLTIVDYVFVGVARTTYEASVQALKTSRESLTGLRGDR